VFEKARPGTCVVETAEQHISVGDFCGHTSEKRRVRDPLTIIGVLEPCVLVRPNQDEMCGFGGALEDGWNLVSSCSRYSHL
jgi:hypothetical protein